MSEYRTKYLLRLNQRAIAHCEFSQAGDEAVETISKMGKDGLARCIDLDGNEVVPNDDDAYWEITDKGVKAMRAR